APRPVPVPVNVPAPVPERPGTGTRRRTRTRTGHHDPMTPRTPPPAVLPQFPHPGGGVMWGGLPGGGAGGGVTPTHTRSSSRSPAPARAEGLGRAGAPALARRSSRQVPPHAAPIPAISPAYTRIPSHRLRRRRFSLGA